jgi:hypothetical protein
MACLYLSRRSPIEIHIQTQNIDSQDHFVINPFNRCTANENQSTTRLQIMHYGRSFHIGAIFPPKSLKMLIHVSGSLSKVSDREDNLDGAALSTHINSFPLFLTVKSLWLHCFSQIRLHVLFQDESSHVGSAWSRGSRSCR